MNKTKRFMYTVSLVTLLLMFVFFFIAESTGRVAITSLGITSMTICYHFTIRLVIGNILDRAEPEYFKPDSRRFREMSGEKRFYKAIHVKTWKKFLPTYNENYFSLKTNTAEGIIGETCRAEVVHSLNIVASFASIAFSSLFGMLPVFILTAVLGALVDLVFVIVQRYNRPRLRRLADRDGWQTVPTTEISLAEGSDAEEIAALYHSLLGLPGCTWDEEYPTIDFVREDIEHGSLYKVEEMGRIVAAAYLGEFEEIEHPDCLDNTFNHLGELARVGVLRELHRNGIAETLLRHLLEEAPARGFDGIALLVGRDNTAAIALYEKIGFENRGEVRLYDTDWYCCQIKIDGSR